MITTLAVLAAVCLVSLAFILIIPHFAATKALMRFLPGDIREAAEAHPDPPFGRQMIPISLSRQFQKISSVFTDNHFIILIIK